jgi:hypothetical protein
VTVSSETCSRRPKPTLATLSRLDEALVSFVIDEALVSFVTTKETLPTWTSMLDCTTTATTIDEDTDDSDVTGLLLAQNILRGVDCAVHPAGSLLAAD